MARPVKVGLDYYPADTNRRNDFKIMDLLEQYGPIGYVVYDFCLQYIYENGYFLEVPLKQLELSLIKDIGSKWIKNKNLVGQVIHYCADIGLFDTDLFKQNVITSVGIQRRYDVVTARNKAQKSKYWLLEKNNIQEADVSAPINEVSATETGVSATITPVSVTEIQQRKVNEIKEKENKENKNKLNKNKENERESKERFPLRVYGRFSNVYLTYEELMEGRRNYPNSFNDKIERLSSYIASSGNKYENHYAKLLEWLEADNDEQKSVEQRSKASYDIDELEKINILNDY